jgi:hypothetical protein
MYEWLELAAPLQLLKPRLRLMLTKPSKTYHVRGFLTIARLSEAGYLPPTMSPNRSTDERNTKERSSRSSCKDSNTDAGLLTEHELPQRLTKFATLPHEKVNVNQPLLPDQKVVLTDERGKFYDLAKNAARMNLIRSGRLDPLEPVLYNFLGDLKVHDAREFGPSQGGCWE